MSSLINVHNEWDPIEEIIVGSPLHASMPYEDKGFQVIQQASHDLFDALQRGAIPKKIVDETEEDIQVFIGELHGFYKNKVTTDIFVAMLS